MEIHPAITKRELELIDDFNPCLSEDNVNKYMELITQVSPDTIYAFNTNFYTALYLRGYFRLHRWTKKVDIFSKQRLFIPIYIASECRYTLVNINFDHKTIRYYDNYSRRNDRCQHLIMKYLKLEYLMRTGSFFNVNGWRFITLNQTVSKYKDWDCGVYICAAAEYLSRGPSKSAFLVMCETQEAQLRRRILCQILRKRI